jgi:Metallo-peptidase family M12B Reprolysin-like
MATKRSKPDQPSDSAPKLLSENAAAEAQDKYVHIYHNGAVCRTDKRGYATPEDRDPTELVLDATEGFIPLWDKDTTLRWRFNETSMMAFANPAAAKTYFRNRMRDALALWGTAVPVRFTEVSEAWDFEVVFDATPKCNPVGCVLASAFFPDAGQHDVTIFSTLLDQTAEEIVETLAHEFGHVFGLRHFFAKVSEGSFPSEIFGTHNKQSIMNYGKHSKMTARDRTDLKSLYTMAWSGQLTQINGTPVRLVRPFSHMRVQQAPLALAAARMV